MIFRRVSLSILLALPFLAAINALHFYLDSNEKRCFIEELPKDTAVVGHYKAEEWNEESKSFQVNPNLGVQITVEEVATGHSVVNTRGLPSGKFTFTSHEPGDHSICLSTNETHGWFGGSHVRMHFDIAVGDAKHDHEGDKEHINELSTKVHDLVLRVEDIRREQQYQREREAEFRDLSEHVNSRVVWYSLLQITVLLGTCMWQSRHLRNFFADKKLR